MPQSQADADPPAGMLETGQPSRTALQVAVLRAAHQFLDEPRVLDDPFALPILGAQRAAAMRAEPFRFNEPMQRALRASLVVRSHFAEDALAEAVQSGVGQYVVLGAGLDTFGYRNPFGAALQVFEVDHPATQAWKRRLLQEAGIPVPESMRFAPVDFSRQVLTEALAGIGFRADRPAFFSWLGVSVYLEPETVLETLRQISLLPRGSGIVFDYRIARARMNAMESPVLDSMAQRVAQQGEPWKSTFDQDELARALRRLGFADLLDLGAEELNARYLANRRDGLRKSGGFRLMRAQR